MRNQYINIIGVTIIVMLCIFSFTPSFIYAAEQMPSRINESLTSTLGNGVEKNVTSEQKQVTIPLSSESIDSWMPDKNLQLDILNYLIQRKLLPVGSTVEDITKEVASKNDHRVLDIYHDITSLEGLQYFSGSSYGLDVLNYQNTNVSFPDLKPVEKNGLDDGSLELSFINTNFCDLSEILVKIRSQLATLPNLTTIRRIPIGFSEQHFADISSWYNFEKQFNNIESWRNPYYSFTKNTINAEAQLQEDGTIILSNPLYIYDVQNQGKRVPLSTGITASNSGQYDSTNNLIVWKNADPSKQLLVNWNSYIEGVKPGDFSPIFSGTIDVKTLGRPVIVQYIDEQGNSIQKEDTITGYFGDSYSSSPKDIQGYTFDHSEGNLTGIIGAHSNTITYIYKKDTVAGGNVVVKYLDTLGNKVSDEIIKTGNVGENYSTNQKNIQGYTFKEVQGNISGQFTEQVQTVTYVYTKNPVKATDVTVNYVDEDGNAIPSVSPQTISGNVGDSYDATTDVYKLTIDGYTLDESKLPTNAKGTLSDQVQTVTYVYTKNKVNPVLPEPKPEKKSDSKDKNNNKGIKSSDQHGLPATGENERITMMSIILGLILVALATVVSIFRFKKANK